jgi:hypothetical protein
MVWFFSPVPLLISEHRLNLTHGCGANPFGKVVVVRMTTGGALPRLLHGAQQSQV